MEAVRSVNHFRFRCMASQTSNYPSNGRMTMNKGISIFNQDFFYLFIGDIILFQIHNIARKIYLKIRNPNVIQSLFQLLNLFTRASTPFQKITSNMDLIPHRL